jgi:transposase
LFFRDKSSGKSGKPVLQLIESVRTEKGVRQRLVVSLGTRIDIPKEIRVDVAKIVKERLQGQVSLFPHDSKLLAYADKVVKKIQTEGKWNNARKRVSEFSDKNPNIAEIFVQEVNHCYERTLGPLFVGHTFWKRLQFTDILRECGLNDSEIKTAQISVLHRLIEPGSENDILPWLNTVAADELLEVNSASFGKDRFYRISDKLYKNREFIEENLYQREKTLFSLEDSVFLYDLTNTYFEGICAQNPKAEYSKNQKEKRSDCPQVVVALMLDGDGFVRRHRIFNGKMTDVKSLQHIMDSIRDEFDNSKKPTIIFDRGMVSDDNMKLMKNYEDLSFIVMCRSGEEAYFINEFSSEQFMAIGGREDKPEVKVSLQEKDNVLYLLCKSEGRKVKEQAMRTSKEKKLEAELNNFKKQIDNGKSNAPDKINQRIGKIAATYSNVSKYYNISYTHWEFSYELPGDNAIIPKRLVNSLKILSDKVKNNKITCPAITKKLTEFKSKYPKFDKIKINLKKADLKWETVDEVFAKETAMEGNYLLKTNRKDLTPDKIWKMYVMLTRIESAFRDLKSYLGLRPNFHQKEHRVDGHIFITLLAYHLLHSIEHTMRQAGERSRWVTIKRVLSTHNYGTIQLPTTAGPVINVRKAGIPEGIHAEIYKKLRIDHSKLPVRQVLA